MRHVRLISVSCAALTLAWSPVAAAQVSVPGEVVALAAARIVLPSLPPDASPKGLDEPVAVDVVVSEEGKVTRADARFGPKPLRAPAEEAARAWELTPMADGDKRVSVESTIYFVYSPAENLVYTQGPLGAYYGRPGAVLALVEGELKDPPEGAGLNPVSRKSPPPAPAGTPAPAPGAGVFRATGVLAGKATSRPQPAYPPLARARDVAGTVVVEVMISKSGLVVWARPVAGHPLLRVAATETARRWRFTPTLLEGEPVLVIGTLSFNFKL